MNRAFVIVALIAMSACQWMPRPQATQRGEPAPGAVATGETVTTYDNHEQVWTERAQAPAGTGAPHVVVTIEPSGRKEWSVWHIHLDSTPPVDASWAIEEVGGAMFPYRAMDAKPATGEAFESKQWTALQACGLKRAADAGGTRFSADVAQCSALVPGIGASSALLPLEIQREGEWLHLRLYADQARGPAARSDLRAVQTYSGWAAINGAGPSAGAESSDWHMNRDVRLGSEGGRAALTWRDGKPSGFALTLERMTYREGNVPVLKLSIVEESSGHSLAYAWANPEATRIGINLGWLQVGLDRAGARSPGAATSVPP